MEVSVWRGEILSGGWKDVIFSTCCSSQTGLLKDEDVQRTHSPHSSVSQQLPRQQTRFMSPLTNISNLMVSQHSPKINFKQLHFCRGELEYIFKWSTLFLWQHLLINHTQKRDGVFHLKTAASVTATHNNMIMYSLFGFRKIKVNNILFQNHF